MFYMCNEKNKELGFINTLQTSVFLDSDIQCDFNNLIKLTQEETTFQVDSVYFNKIPKKYKKIIQRMMNYKSKNNNILDFAKLESSGAGTLSSQSGQILSLLFCSLNDDQVNDVFLKLNNRFEQLKLNGILVQKLALTPSWTLAAFQNRIAILNSIKDDYPNSKIQCACWDVKQQVQSLGLSDYKNNKGYSTDIFIKLDNNKLVQISLKKSHNSMLLNSAIQTVLQRKYNKYLVDIQHCVYSKFYDENKQLVDSFCFEKFDINKTSKQQRKFLLKIIKSSEIFFPYLIHLSDNYRSYINFIVEQVSSNIQYKNKMLTNISQNLPLKSILIGQQILCVADVAINKKTLSRLFNSDNFDNVTHNLIIQQDNGKKYLSYQCDQTIKIARINIREKGVYYNGTIALQMLLEKQFVMKLKQINKEIYNKENEQNTYN